MESVVEHIIINQWKDQDDGALLSISLEYLDVVTLIQKKSACKQWEQLCTQTIDNKCDDKKKKAFESNNELLRTVQKYTSRFVNNASSTSSSVVEDIASTYGYPIDKWDVSNIKAFSYTFHSHCQFNEPIGSWDVSNATTMFYMFCGARSFDQDLSSWDVSNVTDMMYTFCIATSFNQNLSSWNVSNVTDMSGMFHNAASFDQDISTWDVSNVDDFYNMFKHCKFDARRLPWFRGNMN